MRYVLNKEALAHDVRRDIEQHNSSLRKASLQSGVSKSSLHKVVNQRYVSITTFLKVCDWLARNPQQYFETDYSLD